MDKKYELRKGDLIAVRAVVDDADDSLISVGIADTGLRLQVPRESIESVITPHFAVGEWVTAAGEKVFGEIIHITSDGEALTVDLKKDQHPEPLHSFKWRYQIWPASTSRRVPTPEANDG